MDLRNFIGNAVKFSKSKVEVNLKSDEKIIEIEINDDGPGIPEDIINKIGEPYIKSKSKELSSKFRFGSRNIFRKNFIRKTGSKFTI